MKKEIDKNTFNEIETGKYEYPGMDFDELPDCHCEGLELAIREIKSEIDKSSQQGGKLLSNAVFDKGGIYDIIHKALKK